MLKKFFAAVSIISLFAPMATYADHNTAHTISQLQAQIAALQAQIVVLTQQGGGTTPTGDEDSGVTPGFQFTRDLSYGMRNNQDVGELQEFLQDRGYYSGPISGNFFTLTLRAVQKFQKENGLNSTGYFGPKSRAIANRILAGGVDVSPPVGTFQYSVKHQNPLVRGNYFNLSADIRNGPSYGDIRVYLQRPDGTMKYNGEAIEKGGATVDAYGNWSSTNEHYIDIEGQNGRWTSWVSVGGKISNYAYHDVVPTGTVSVLSIETQSLPAGTVGVPYKVDVLGSGGSSSYVWKITSGSLPPGLELNPTACIALAGYICKGPLGIMGTPKISGVYVFDLSLMSGSQSVTKTFKISVSASTSSSITILSPNGGEVWQLGSMHTVLWAPYDPNIGVNSTAQVSAYLEKFDGSSYITVGRIIEAGKASIHWIGELDRYGNYSAPGQYYVRVTNSQTGQSDRSDKPFTLVANNTLKADLKVAGSDGPVTLKSGGGDYTVSWASSAEVCSIYNSTAFGSEAQIDNLAQAGDRTIRIYDGAYTEAAINLTCTSRKDIEGTAYDNVRIMPSGVAQSSVTIVSPNGGENLNYSGTHTITWKTSSDIYRVAIALYKNDSFFNWIAFDLPSYGSGTYQWQPSFTLSSANVGSGIFKIYMIGYKTAGGTAEDKSDNPFSILGQATAKTVTTWTDKKSYMVGETAKFFVKAVDADGTSFTPEEGAEANISLVTPLGKTGSGGTLPYNYSSGYYERSEFIDQGVEIGTWTFSATVYQKGTSNVLGTSEKAYFTISQPTASITVLSPNGGEKWQVGQTYNITWNAVGIGSDSVAINLINTSTGQQYGITSKAPINLPYGLGSSYAWTIPNTIPSGSNYKIAVGYGTTDLSDSTFSIAAPTTQPSVTVTSPNGGEVWKIGETKIMTWTTQGTIPSVNLLLVSSNSVAIIAERISNAGQYTWTVSNSMIAGSYVFRVFAADGSSIYDDSNASFSITAPTVAISLAADKTSGSAPLAVKFTATLYNLPSCGNTYIWKFGDGTSQGVSESCAGTATTLSSRTVSTTHTYNSSGTYYVALSIGTVTSNQLPLSVSSAPTISGITVSLDTSTPVAQNVVAGSAGVPFMRYRVTNSSSQVINITGFSVSFKGTLQVQDFLRATLLEGSTLLSNSSVSLQGSDIVAVFSASGGGTMTTISPGASKVFTVSADISLTAKNGITAYAYLYGFNFSPTGVSGGLPLTGNTMTVASAGQLSVALDAASPGEKLVAANTFDQVLGILRFTATNEAINVQQIALQLSAGASQDLGKVTLWDGATKVGETIFTSTNQALVVLTNFVVPKDSSKILTVKGDLSAIGTNQPGTPGRLVRVDWDGDRKDPAGNSMTKGYGQSSAILVYASGADTQTRGVRVFKSYPTLAKVSIPSTTLTNGQKTVYRFAVTAPSQGGVGLYKFTFKVSKYPSALGVTNFQMYGFSDSAYSQPAYNSGNPLNSSGLTTLDDVPDSAGIVGIYFNPVSVSSTREAIQIPAGSTRYFELRANIAGVVSGSSLSVQLEGDVSPTTPVSSAVNVDNALSNENDFIWSGNSTTISNPTTYDWSNGYLVPGLPNVSMLSSTLTADASALFGPVFASLDSAPEYNLALIVTPLMGVLDELSQFLASYLGE